MQRFSRELGPAERPFYGGILREGGQRVLYFISPTVQHYVRTAENPIKLQMDATFSVVPRAGGALQLFIVHYLYNNSVKNAQQNLALDGNVHLILQRMSHAVDGLFNPPLAVDPLVDQVLPAVAADGEEIAEEFHVAPNIVVEADEALPQEVAIVPAPSAAILDAECICLTCRIEEKTHAFIPCGHVNSSKEDVPGHTRLDNFRKRQLALEDAHLDELKAIRLEIAESNRINREKLELLKQHLNNKS
ncbi:hypothetical protein FQR65_LT15719 [Abscondita terminalis]|nr:hypothetical protein FQR65_LT15719 [Abscondita terminalis]